MQFDSVDFVTDSKVTTEAFNSSKIDVTECGHIIKALTYFPHFLQSLGWSLVSDKQMWQLTFL